MDLSKPTEAVALDACLHAGMHPNEAAAAAAAWAAHDGDGCGHCAVVQVSIEAMRKELG